MSQKKQREIAEVQKIINEEFFVNFKGRLLADNAKFTVADVTAELRKLRTALLKEITQSGYNWLKADAALMIDQKIALFTAQLSPELLKAMKDSPKPPAKPKKGVTFIPFRKLMQKLKRMEPPESN